ncbi:NAD(P)-dependent oxidoreductase [Acuticoccus sp. M5D2P5]|uniref:NAD(P)-dependent oxidoreductase n=1 Tax=Acuticoccus kalidii TaxID=2910977 RepID=UPI001F18EA51|nr:NAD(P)-dependent oxidoreductase [Acuticoccus kalidii]MCF3932025.1 NAD(P)-dependent oxidoreductase [Acuticoccus kalidii]
MSTSPILLIGGAGAVGRWAARHLRAAHPDLPILIGGRDGEKAARLAAEIGEAEGVVVDLAVDDLGLGERPVAAVAVLFNDTRTAALRFAQDRSVPYVSIAPMLNEIAPEVAAYMHWPAAAPVVLATEWLVGATTLPTLDIAKGFGRIDTIAIGALLDDEDTGGPAQLDDLERLTKAAPAALARQNGIWTWRVGEEAKGRLRAVDGTEMAAEALSPNDVLGLAMETGAPNVTFDLAMGVTSSRRRGEPMSTEITIELAGEDRAGRPLSTRHAVVHPQGQFPLTGLGVALLLERLVGLDGGPAVTHGLYFPHQLLDPSAYLKRFEAMGGTLLRLDAA